MGGFFRHSSGRCAVLSRLAVSDISLFDNSNFYKIKAENNRPGFPLHADVTKLL